MRDNDLFDEGGELLADSPASDVLLDVDLSQNRLGIATVRALSAAKHLKKLLVLRLADNSISESAAATLRASPLVRRLAVLEMESAPPVRHTPDPPLDPPPDTPIGDGDPIPF
jgi:hypothetical protein